MTNGIGSEDFTRALRADPKRKLSTQEQKEGCIFHLMMVKLASIPVEFTDCSNYRLSD